MTCIILKMDFYTFLLHKDNTLSWHTSNFESANEKPSFIRVAAFFLMYFYQRQNYQTIVSMEVTSPKRIFEPTFLAVCLKKYKATRIPI